LPTVGFTTGRNFVIRGESEEAERGRRIRAEKREKSKKRKRIIEGSGHNPLREGAISSCAYSLCRRKPTKKKGKSPTEKEFT